MNRRRRRRLPRGGRARRPGALDPARGRGPRPVPTSSSTITSPARVCSISPRPRALKICAGKSSGHCTLNQDQINALLVEHASAGRVVVRLKGGDPMVFGRGAEEAEFLTRHGIRVRGRARRDGRRRGPGLRGHPGHAPGDVLGRGLRDRAWRPGSRRRRAGPQAESDARLDWPALASFPGTLVVYMGVTHLAAIGRTLIRQGKPAETPAAVIESGTLPSQRVVEGTLGTIAGPGSAADIRPPALLVVGKVVERRSELAWFESLPLFGQRIVITRPADEADRSAAVLEALGAEVLLAPMVRILPLTDFGPLDRGHRPPGRLRLARVHLEQRRALLPRSVPGAGPRPACPGTDLDSRPSARGRPTPWRGITSVPTWSPTPIAPRPSPRPSRSGRRVQKILLARADRGRAVLKDELAKVAAVDQVPVYRNVDAESLPEDVLGRISDGTVDWITLTSSAIASSACTGSCPGRLSSGSGMRSSLRA